MPKGERFYVRIARGFFRDCRQEIVIVVSFSSNF
jgi:hypothetical protein